MKTIAARNQPYPYDIQPGLTLSNNLPSVENDNRELFRVRAVWFLDFFPDELVIQEKTVSIIKREFLASYVETLPVLDIGEVEMAKAFLFASITIIGKIPAHKLEIKA